MSNKVLQFRSAVPFWSGEYGADLSCLIPLLLSNAWYSLPVNSVPLSDLMHLTFQYGAIIRPDAFNLSIWSHVSKVFFFGGYCVTLLLKKNIQTPHWNNHL